MKRKNLLLILVAALVLSSFFVACKADIEAPSGELVDVTFAMDGSRALSATLEDFDPDLYYWKYAAAKNAADTSGLNSGATEGYNGGSEAREAGALWIHEGVSGLSGTVPGFSQGLWDFTLYAYTNEGTSESPVYSLTYLGEAKAVSLVKSGLNKVHVVVSPAPEGNGKLYIGETTLNPKKQGDIPSVSRFLKVEDFNEHEYAPTSGTTYILPAGTYRVTVTYKASGITYADGMVIATVYPNMTTTVTGSVDELVTYAQFEAEQNPDIITRTAGVDGITSTTTGDEQGNINLSEPTTVEDKKISATVPAAAAVAMLPKVGENPDPNASMSLELNVDTKDSTSTSVTYEISMTKIVTLNSEVTTTDVDTLGTDPQTSKKYYAVATVQLSTGLTGVKVTHNGQPMVESESTGDDDGHGVFFYYASTGILKIQTNTFSPFQVTYDGETAGVAEVNGVKYATLKAAVEAAQAGDIVKLLSDAEGAGMSINKSITIDFNGKTYTGTKEPAGSTGTQSQLFQLLGGTIVMKNGTLSSVSGSGIKMLVNNYSDLTLNSMTLDGTNLDDSNVMYYTLSCNKGDVVITGNTIIIAHSDNGTATGKAFDVWGPYGGGGNRTVTFDEDFTGKVKGVIEYTAAPAGRNAQLIIKAGDFSDTELTIDGTLSDESFISIMGGVFGWNPWKYVADGYEAIYNPSTGLWTVSEIPGDGVAKIGTDYYDSLQEAIDDAESGETVELLRDITSNAVLKVVDDVTIEGNYKTVKYASMTTSSRALWIDADDVTLNLKNLTLDGNNVCERGVQVNQLQDGEIINHAVINMENCQVINITYYAINICQDTIVQMTIDNSYISGWAAINHHGNDSIISITDSTLVGINNNSGTSNSFATVVIDGNSFFTPGSTVSGNTMTITDSTIIAQQNGDQKQYWISYQYGANGNTSSVSVSGTTILDSVDGQDKSYEMYISGIGNYVILPLSADQLAIVQNVYDVEETQIEGVYSVTSIPEIWYSNATYNPENPGAGMYTKLKTPFVDEWIWPGEAVKLMKNLTLSENITYVGGTSGTAGKTYILMNGHTISGGYFIIGSVSETTEIVSDASGISDYFRAEGFETKENDNGDGTYSYTFVAYQIM